MTARYSLIVQCTRVASALVLSTLVLGVGASAYARGPYTFSGGVGGGSSLPPTMPQPAAPSPRNVVDTFLVVKVEGALPAYTVVVTTPGGFSCVESTNAEGVAAMSVPWVADLELTVLGTGVVGLPVQAGQVLTIQVN